MSNKLEAAVHGNAWDALDEFSDTDTSKSDFRTAIISLGGVFDLAAARTLTKKQLDLIVRASHTDAERPASVSEQGELNALKAYQKARRKLASEVRPADEKQRQELIRQVISDGIGDLVTISGQNSRDHGFHEDWPPALLDGEGEPAKRQIGLAITEKLALQHEEISESLGEIRSGRHPLEIYFVDTKGVLGDIGREFTEQHYDAVSNAPLLKPEGFLVEQADAIIRIADLTFLVNGRERLIEALTVKHEYNSTRPYKHGRKF